MNEEEDLFCLSEPYRFIYDDYNVRLEADKIYEETGSLEEMEVYCKKIILEKRAKKLLKETKFDKRFKLRTLENFKEYNQTAKKAKERAIKYIENLNQYLEDGTNLIIEGAKSIGTGKTHLACAITLEAMKRGIPSKFVNVIDLLTQLKDTFDITPYVKIELLVIDDFGKEKGTEWVFETIYGIINSRYEKMLPTVITTEGYMGEMTSHYKEKGQAILSRLSESFVLIRLDGEDRRKLKV